MNEKEMKSLENQLRSWHPRRPSAKIKRRLFPNSSEETGLSLRWLAPAAACLLLALTMASQQPGLSASSARQQAIMGLISSNLSYTSLSTDSEKASHNRISSTSFEWTNLSESSS